MKEIFSLPFDEALAHSEIDSLKKQRDALQAKIDAVLAIDHKPIHEADNETERSSRRGFNQFRLLVQTHLARTDTTEE